MNYGLSLIKINCIFFFGKIIYYLIYCYKILFNFSNNFRYSNKLHKFNFIKNSMIINSCDLMDEIPTLIEYDYIVLKDKYKDKTILNIFGKIEQLDYLNNVPVNYNFLLVLLINDTDKYNITGFLNNPNHFYYNVNSLILDKKFINWIFIYHLRENNVEISLKNYKISIMDNMANTFEITNKNGVMLRENTYEVINMK